MKEHEYRYATRTKGTRIDGANMVVSSQLYTAVTSSK